MWFGWVIDAVGMFRQVWQVKERLGWNGFGYGGDLIEEEGEGEGVWMEGMREMKLD